jgi:hypothetical protein
LCIMSCLYMLHHGACSWEVTTSAFYRGLRPGDVQTRLHAAVLDVQCHEGADGTNYLEVFKSP